jgi:hypothetical protein
MPYVLLIHEPVGQRATRTRAEGEAVYQRMLDFAGRLKDRDQLLAVESLAAADENTARVQVRGGPAQARSSPFAEAKEMVGGGFFLLNCKSRDEAVAIAKACPAAEWATVKRDVLRSSDGPARRPGRVATADQLMDVPRGLREAATSVASQLSRALEVA